MSRLWLTLGLELLSCRNCLQHPTPIHDETINTFAGQGRPPAQKAPTLSLHITHGDVLCDVVHDESGTMSVRRHEGAFYTSQTATNNITTALDLCISARTGIVIAHVRRVVLVWLSSLDLAPATIYALSHTFSQIALLDS